MSGQHVRAFHKLGISFASLPALNQRPVVGTGPVVAIEIHPSAEGNPHQQRELHGAVDFEPRSDQDPMLSCLESLLKSP
jgi:hypothetical protein